MKTIRCGHCHQIHHSTEAVRACSQGNLFSCHWLVQRYVGEPGEMWLTEVDCGAEAIATERGWACTAGHEHITMQARWNEGWDYAEDAGEALALVGAGRQPYTMDGHIATSPRDFVPTYAHAAGF